MNIRIPYEKLGDIKSYRFVSFILDKNYKSIYRLDIVNGENKDFFNYSQQFISISDAVYEECDSVIFFPHSNKTNNWGTKVIMWKKDGDFIKFNGGYEFVRNADVEPDLEKLKDWLARGRGFDKSEPDVGKKNLIYFTLFGNNEYINLLQILLKSLNNQPYKDFDLLFITDAKTKKEIRKLKELKSFKTNYHVIDSVENSVDASMQKLKIYEWKSIDRYKNILFLDVDIVVLGNIGGMFENKNMKNNIFYSATHNHDQLLHKTVYHSLIDYTDEQLDNFSTKGIVSLNAGQFIFRNTDTMKKHFNNITKFVSEWSGRYFFEQSFLNYYFNLLEISDVRFFIEQFQFVSINERHTDNKFGPNSVFVHFMGNACNGLEKLEFMKKYYGKYIL